MFMDGASGVVLLRTPTVRAIIDVVAAHFGVSKMDLLAHRRTANVVIPRQIVMYLAGELTPYSLSQIGRCIDRDSTTVFHGMQRISKLINEDRGINNSVALLLGMVSSQ